MPRDVGELRRRLEPVLHEQVQVVALVQHLDLDLGVQLAQATRLAVLLRHELLVERRDLDVLVVRGQVEVGRERLHRVAVAVTSRARTSAARTPTRCRRSRAASRTGAPSCGRSGPARAGATRPWLSPPRRREPDARRRCRRARRERRDRRAAARGCSASTSPTTAPSGTMLRTPWPCFTRSIERVAVAGEDRVRTVEHDARGLPVGSPRRRAGTRSPCARCRASRRRRGGSSRPGAGRGRGTSTDAACRCRARVRERRLHEVACGPSSRAGGR